MLGYLLTKQRERNHILPKKKKEVETLLMAIKANQEPESDVWFVDTGCSNHVWM